MKTSIGEITFNADTLCKIRIINIVVETNYQMVRGSLISRCRKREWVEPRHVAMSIIRWVTEMDEAHVPYATIGAYFGDYDHATVHHAIRAIGDLCTTDKKFKARYTNLLEECRMEIEKYNFDNKIVQ